MTEVYKNFNNIAVITAIQRSVMDNNKKNKKYEVIPEKAYIDGVASISMKLGGYVRGKPLNVYPLAQLILRLLLPEDLKEANSEDVEIAVRDAKKLIDYFMV